MGDSVEHLLAPTHPPVEVVGRSSGHHLVKARVDEVWADLEGLHREPAAPERFEQADRDGRLADATRHPGDDEHAGLHETSTCDVEVDEPISPWSSREDRLTVVRAWAGLLALGSSYSPRLPGSLASGSRGFRPRSQ